MPEAERTRSRGVADVARELYAEAYPDRTGPPGWIDGAVDEAVARIEKARNSVPSASPGARLLTNKIINHANPREREPAWRRVYTWVTRYVYAWIVVSIAGLIALAIVAGLLFAVREWAAQAAISTAGILAAVAGIAGAGALAVWSYWRSRQERVLSCRIRIDVPFDVDDGEKVRLVGKQRDNVPDPGVVVVRVANTGGEVITPDDYVSPLALWFPGRKVVSVDATAFKGENLERHLSKEAIKGAVQGDRVSLPAFELEPGDSFKLVIVLSGTKVGVAHEAVVEGGLRDGRITTVQGRDRVPPQTIAWGALSAVGVGILAVVLLLNNVTPFTRLPAGVTCAPGSLTVAGSSAFGATASALAVTYEAYCPASSVSVLTPGSREGLERLLEAPADAEQLALTDGLFDQPQFDDLTATPLAVVPFTLVGSEDVPVDSLTLRDVREIFGGEAQTWSDITGDAADTAEIRVVGRSPGSGTRATLEQKVLSIAGDPAEQVPSTSDNCRDRRPGEPDEATIVCERFSTADLIDQVAHLDGAIGYADLYEVDQAADVRKIDLVGLEASLTDIRDHGYPFWAVEYVYSRSGSSSTSLSEVFKAYLFSPRATETMERFDNYACIGATAELCERD